MNHKILEQYSEHAGLDVIEHLKQLVEPLVGLKVVHVNSTKLGGGVAEILDKMVILMRELGIDTSWEVISGEAEFYTCTKNFHNAIQGNRVNVSDSQLEVYERTNAETAERLRDKLQEADIVFIHDPQPAAMIKYIENRRAKWIWRCHIDASKPFRPVWKHLKNIISAYDASVFSLASFAQRMPHPVYLIAPSIDPLHRKNMNLNQTDIDEVYSRFDIDPERPIMLQVSRYDRFKDPVGVILAYRLAKKMLPHIQLVLAGGGASDDPEGEIILNEVRMAAGDDPDIKILLLPGDAHLTINALQRAADIVLQKSIREGFGLTVAEAMWKNKPVIGGDTGGIRIQVVNHHTGFLVNTPEGAALRIRYLLSNPDILSNIGRTAKEFVRENFLNTRHLREYFTLFYAVLHNNIERIELS